MNLKRIYLSSPTMHGDELKFMTQAYESNWVTTAGENVNAIEKEFSNYIGVNHAVALGSGTAALHLAVKLAGVKAGDKVFCSDVTFAATINPVVYEKAEPIFIDTEYDTWNMCPKSLEKAFELYPEVKVVIFVHLYGVPAKIDEIRAICKKHNAIIVEDAAESLGATYKGVQTGAFGDISIISFNGNKIITGSSGGMLLTNNEAHANKAKKWSTQSRENASWYQHEEIGYNYRISNIVAGVVRGQLPYLKEHIAQKKALYDRYKEGFKDLPVTMNPFDKINSTSNYWLSCLLIDHKAMCKQERSNGKSIFISEKGKSCPDEILENLAKENIEGRPIWKPMHMQPIFGKCTFVTKNGEDNNSNIGMDLFNRGICLPSDNKMTIEQQNIIIEIVKKSFN